MLSVHLSIAVWFGVIAGLAEGLGLLWFQRVNWARWGAMIHVSEPIVWIAVAVDVSLFVVLAFLWSGVSMFAISLKKVKYFVFLLAFLTIYDWLSVTGRLRVTSCVLLGLGVAAVFVRWMDDREQTFVRFWRRTALWAAAVALLTFAGIEGGHKLAEQGALVKLPPPKAGAPNVLVVVVDTLRADHLSCYGYARPTSLNLDRMAKQGVLFENAISAASWSLPSHASMLTGRYQFEHRVSDVDGTPIRDSAIAPLGGFLTLGEALAQRGYRTGAFSANRSYFSANLGFGHGFLHFEDYFHSPADGFVRTLFGGELAGMYLKATRTGWISRTFSRIGAEHMLDASFEGAGGLSGAHVRKRASTVNQEVLHWIDGESQGHPFFAFLNYFDVHNPYGGPPDYAAGMWFQNTSIDQYDKSVRYIDDQFGRLMNELGRRGLAENTLVIVTSDHGESLGQHGLSYHGHSLYRELIQVPLIFWYPGHVPADVRVSSSVTNAAIPLTVMNLLGAPTAQFPGQPLDALWKATSEKPKSTGELSELAEEHFLEPEDEGADLRIPIGTTGAMKSIIGERWHLIIHKKFGSQLYDWVNDPSETKNVFYTPEGAEVSRQLMAGMQDRLAGASDQQDSISTAVEINGETIQSSGTMQASLAQNSQLPGRVNDYYRFRADAGTIISVNVRPMPGTKIGTLDTVVSISDAKGTPLQTCRNPEDDGVQVPAAADPTPDSYDDICVNDDATPGVQSDSRLEILVPGSPYSPVELYIRVSDWNGLTGVGLRYQIAVSGSAVDSTADRAQR
ncbi:MAG TPA: sulfatase [Terriglobales bacterium]|jgi:arylsulfatase A-like enzyme